MDLLKSLFQNRRMIPQDRKVNQFNKKFLFNLKKDSLMIMVMMMNCFWNSSA